MYCIGRLHFQRQMGPLGVINLYQLAHHAPSLLQIGGPL